MTELQGRRIEDVFGYPDYLKFRSSMTLFAHAAASSVEPFSEALARYFASTRPTPPRPPVIR